MYQKNGDYVEKLDVAVIAADIAEWAITRYGYFINSHTDKLEMVQAFAEELNRLPSGSLIYVDKAKNQWIDYSHKRPPTMPDFLSMLREFYNHQENKNVKSLVDNREQQATHTANMWSNAKSNEQKKKFLETFKNIEASSATKWVIREWMRDNKYEEKAISQVLGKPF